MTGIDFPLTEGWTQKKGFEKKAKVEGVMTRAQSKTNKRMKQKQEVKEPGICPNYPGFIGEMRCPRKEKAL